MSVGIAATTAVFSVVDAALFRPPPFPDAHRLAIIYTTRQRGNAPAREGTMVMAAVPAARGRAGSFTGVASFTPSVLALTGERSEPATRNSFRRPIGGWCGSTRRSVARFRQTRTRRPVLRRS
jgi:hypothetical protein